MDVELNNTTNLHDSEFSLFFLKSIYFLLLFLIFLAVPLSFIALKNSYFLVSSSAECLPQNKIKKIGPIELSSDFWLTFPEFFSRSSEDKWWHVHEQVFTIFQSNKLINIVIGDKDNEKSIMAFVKKHTVKSVIDRLYIGYLVAFCFLISAFLLYQHHNNIYGILISTFLVSCALYTISAISIVYRTISLDPFYLKSLIHLNYISGGFLISLVHFSLIFPKPKRIVLKYPFLIWILYLYVLIVTFLYFAGVTAYDFSLPFFFLWVSLLLYCLIDTIINEPDPFVKRQFKIILFAPLFISIIFIILHIIPLMLGLNSLDFNYFCLISLILAFALPISIDNIRIYEFNIKLQNDLQKEKDELRREVHDFVLRKFSFISMASQNIMRFLEKKEYKKIYKRIAIILKETKLSSNDLRFCLEILSEKECTWSDYIKKVRNYSYNILEPYDIKVHINADDNLPGKPNHLDLLKIQTKLFWILSEALANIIIHANADHVFVFFKCDNNYLKLIIKDDGIGFDIKNHPSGHAGLLNIEKHVFSLKGELNINSIQTQGTTIEVTIPI